MKVNFFIDDTDRLTGSINSAGTQSFRASSSMLFGRFGTNIQNMPESLQECIVPKPGNVIIKTDQEGAEARVVAYDANCPTYMRCFELGIKPHVLTALNLFIDQFVEEARRDSIYFRPPDELVKLPDWKELNQAVKKNKQAYALGKMVNHASNYMMSWHTFIINCLEKSDGMIRLTQSQAKTMLVLYFKLFPEVKDWQESIRERIEQDGILYNLFGEPRTFVQRVNDAYIRSGVSYIAQSTVGEITHRGAVKFQKLAHRTWHLLSNVHDALVAECPESDGPDCRHLVESCLSVPLVSSDGKREFLMTVESAILNRWHEFEN